MGVPTIFAKVFLEAHYLDQLYSAVTDVVGTPVRVQLKVWQNAHKREDSPPSTSHKRGNGSDRLAFVVLVTKEESWYRALLSDIPAYAAVGKTREEAVQRVHEAFQPI